MTAEEIKSALATISRADSQSAKYLLLTALCTNVFAARGVDVVVLSDCAPVSGEIDLYAVSGKCPSPRDRQEIMGQLGAVGGSHSWQVAGTRITLLMGCTRDPQSSIRNIGTPLGKVAVARKEALFV